MVETEWGNCSEPTQNWMLSCLEVLMGKIQEKKMNKLECAPGHLHALLKQSLTSACQFPIYRQVPLSARLQHLTPVWQEHLCNLYPALHNQASKTKTNICWMESHESVQYTQSLHTLIKSFFTSLPLKPSWNKLGIDLFTTICTFGGVPAASCV